jgi:hypothetical protein
MASPNQFDSPVPFTKPCLVCGEIVRSEQNIAELPNGKVRVWYSPASRYWNEEGVFCSPEHGLIYNKGKTIES